MFAAVVAVWAGLFLYNGLRGLGLFDLSEYKLTNGESE